MLTTQLHAPETAFDDEILDLSGVAALLRVSEASILDRVAHGGFPARRFGPDWRISRTAVTAWLHGTDPTTDRSTGFATG